MKTAARNILILLLIAATLAIIYWLIINYYDDKNRTDDAQVDGDIVPVLARTDGFVDSVYVDDDQLVHAGDIMLQLDTTDLYLKLRQALNAYNVSITNLRRSEIGIKAAQLDKKMATQSIEIKSNTTQPGDHYPIGADLFYDHNKTNDDRNENYKSKEIDKMEDILHWHL